MNRLTPEQQLAWTLWFHRGPSGYRGHPWSTSGKTRVEYLYAVHSARDTARRAQRAAANDR